MTRRLLLIPTEYEYQQIAAEWASWRNTSFELAICGFGPVASAARCASLLSQGDYSQVLLIGLAGRLNPLLTIGEAYQFSSVICHGIGAGEGPEHRSAQSLGWNHWSGSPSVGVPGPDVSITDRLVLEYHQNSMQRSPQLGETEITLLSVCSASGSRAEAAERIDRYPNVSGEDMETFSVAVACHMLGIPLTVLRGISNEAGDRDHSRWKTKLAMNSALQLMRKIFTDG